MAGPCNVLFLCTGPAAVETDLVQQRLAFSDTYRMLRNRTSIFCSLPIASLDRMSLQTRVSDIGKL